jgi:GNAT superfamily N-acetyltransferase
MAVTFAWRGPFSSTEANALHAEAFGTRAFTDEEWDWATLVERHSLGWVTARDGDGVLVGFVNIVWDGAVHAWLQDTMVAASARRQGVGTALVASAVDGARDAGCDYLHVDFGDHLEPFYFDACGFTPTTAGLLELR